MFLAARCAICDRPGGSPCGDSHSRLRPPVPEPDPPGLPGLTCLLAYEGGARQLVARVKYGNRRQALSWMATGLAGAVAARGVPVDIVTWPPTTAEHRRGRGFDHAELLARAVAHALGTPARLLLERSGGVAQTGRDARARRDRGPGFAVTAAPRPGEFVLVVDDIVTTGATLSAAADALRACGAEVGAAALARTPGRLARAGA